MAEITALIEANPQADVALFSSVWLYLLWYDNVWIQGEAFHKGLIECTEAFLETQGVQADLSREMGDFSTSVFSNYIIAKRRFWEDWKALARAYYDHVEKGGSILPDNAVAQHAGPKQYALKTFVQERLASWLLTRGDYTVVHADYIDKPIDGLTPDDPAPLLRLLLRTVHGCKAAARRGVPGARPGYHLVRRVAARLHRHKRDAVRQL
ncbi:hypothetical protein [Paracoccus sp. (in: a-proteobacteria)]|uniref:hypothetical protein n=1 Tax=Paracoccus sp. TaxID=267 RepID=UPI003A8B739C